MSLLRIKRSVTEFIRRRKKANLIKACKSLDEILSSMVKAPEPETGATYEDTADETSFLETLGDAYHEPEILDIHRSEKYGLGSPVQLSAVVFSPITHDTIGDIRSPAFTVLPGLEPLATVRDLAVVPRTPLLPSTPVFEDSLNIFDISASPCTPSLTCSTPALSSPTSDVSAPSFTQPRAVKIRDFELLQFLSKGSCGQVYLARDNVSKKEVALKVIRKVAGVWDHPFVKQILMGEKKIMESLQGLDWFVQLEASWHDTNNIYLAMVYYPTDIESEIIRCEKFAADRARFYMVEMIMALEELHKRGIIHRDIKAANILIRADGHIVLADFGLAKDFGREPTIAERSYQPYWPFRTEDNVYEAPRRPATELTFVTNDWCGSEMEMAPEIVRHEYYSFGVDYWASGVTLYAMVTGRHPWTDDEDVPAQILEEEVQFVDEDDVSNECKDFICQLLKKDPAERLRIGLDITSHPYFAGVDWEAMRNKAVSPPWVPDFVTGHHFFEDWGTIEHFEPGHALEKDEADVLPDFAYTSPGLQHRVLEDTFDHSNHVLPNTQQNTTDETSDDYDSQPGIPENYFGYMFRFGPEDEADDDEDENEDLGTFDIEDDIDDVPLKSVETHSPMISTLESCVWMSASFHSGSSLLNNLDRLSHSESHVTVQFVICSVPEPITAQDAVLEERIVLSNVTIECDTPELLESSTLATIPLAPSSENLPEPANTPPVEASPPVVSNLRESSPDSNPKDPRIIESPTPKLLKLATLHAVEPVVDFTKPPPFTPVLEPLTECPEPLNPFDHASFLEGQIQQETRAISLYNKVMSWLKKVLPWATKGDDGSSVLTVCTREDMSFWDHIKWKFRKMWMPKVKPTPCLQRKQTVIY
ncbi:hypothetical protein APHAL10511_002868 [Amanita phalloides]|nr:hypothetical protein APHAL10511_002868 [Amanita phalloides]